MDSFRKAFKDYRWIWSLCALAGLVVGLGGYTFYAFRGWSYLTDDPSACLNCHKMGTYYQSWARSSHAQWATCNDCHLPQDNLFRQYGTKAADGMYHTAVFVAGGEPQVIRARRSTSEVVMENCVRCHSPLVTEFTRMNAGYSQIRKGETRLCWDCHNQVPHTNISNLASTAGLSVPFPNPPVPNWLKTKPK